MINNADNGNYVLLRKHREFCFNNNLKEEVFDLC